MTKPLTYPERAAWLVVYPRQITSLRHVWTHPAFGDVAPKIDQVTASIAWITALGATVGRTYETIMEGAEDWREDKRRGGYGAYICGGAEMEGEVVPDEFWTHYEIVTGQKVPEVERGSFFTCSC